MVLFTDEASLTGLMVLNAFNLPLQRFGFGEEREASAWARENEPFFGAFRVVAASDSVVRYSWRGNV